MAQDNVDNSIATHAPSVVQIESNKLLPLLLILCVMVGACISAVVIGYSMLRDRVMDAETETRMLEYYVMQSDAELVRNGLKKPEDTFKQLKKE